jgi:uncharacterized protein (TIGR00645 family)
MLRTRERILLASRWLLAPFFLGLLVGLIALLVKGGQHAIHIAETMLSASESETILAVLGLVDLTLAASLVLIIMFAGYENFIAPMGRDASSDWPVWLTKIDFTGMKLKLMASIVSISAIQLLRVFMSIDTASERELIFSVALHLTFVVSGLLLALTDRLSGGHGNNAE